MGSGASAADAAGRPGGGHAGSATAVSTTDWVATTDSTAVSLTSSAKWQAVRWPSPIGAELRLLGHAALGVAELLAQPAAGVEAAAGRRRGRRGHVALQDEALLATARVGVGDRRQEGDRVRVARVAVELLDRALLDELAEVHHADPVAEVLDDREVVADEEVRQVEVAAQVEQQVQDLALDRHVERRHRLVADDEVRLEREGPGDADALALAAAELVRIAPRVVAPEADDLERVLDALVARLAVA